MKYMIWTNNIRRLMQRKWNLIQLYWFWRGSDANHVPNIYLCRNKFLVNWTSVPQDTQSPFFLSCKLMSVLRNLCKTSQEFQISIWENRDRFAWHWNFDSVPRILSMTWATMIGLSTNGPIGIIIARVHHSEIMLWPYDSNWLESRRLAATLPLSR